MRTRFHLSALLLASLWISGCGGKSGSSPLSVDGTWALQVVESVGCENLPASFLSRGDPQLFPVNQTGASVAAQFVDNGGALCTLDGTYRPDEFRGTLMIQGSVRTVVLRAEGFARVHNGRRQVDGTLHVVSDTEEECVGGVIVFCAEIQQGSAPAVNRPPTLVFLEPDDGFSVDPGATVQIVYIDDDPDDVATTTLYADRDGNLSTTGDQVVIAANRPEGNGAQTVLWDTSGVEPGRYRIFGVTTDGEITITTEAPGGVTIRTPAGNAPPTVVVSTPASDLRFCPGNILHIAYTDNDSDDVATTSLFADPDGDLATTAGQITIATDRPETDGASQTVSWDTQGVALDTYFIVARTDDGSNPPVLGTASGTVELVAPDTLTSVRREGGSGNDEARDVASFADGSFVVVGYLGASVTFGLGEANETTLTSAGGDDVLVARYHADGTLAWARRAGGTGSDIAVQVETFADGSCAVTGEFGFGGDGLGTFGPGEANETTLTSAGDWDVFVARFDADGDLAWVRGMGDTEIDEGIGIATFADGSCVATGRFHGTATFGAGEANETVLASAGDFDIFLARYEASGDLIWARRAGSTALDEGLGVASFLDGSWIATGSFRGAATFGEGEANETTLVGAVDSDLFVARYNADNTLAWARSAETAGLDIARGFQAATFDDGTCVVAGFLVGAATFGPGEANETTVRSITGGQSALVARYNADGTLDWARQIAGTQQAIGLGLVSFADGSCVVTGRCLGDVTFSLGEVNELTRSAIAFNLFAATYNADGSLACGRIDGGTVTAVFGTGVAGFPDGSVVAVGSFGATAPATFGGGEANETTLVSAGARDIFIARYSAVGGP